MNSGLFFRGIPVKVVLSYPKLGFVCISLVSDDDFEKTFLDLFVQDNFSHAFDLVKELLDFYES